MGSSVTLLGCALPLALLLLTGCESEAPRGTCVDPQGMTLTALEARYATDVHPLLVRGSEAGGCATCHAPDKSQAFTVWPGAHETLEHLWAKGYLASAGDRNLLTMLTRTDPKRMPLGGQRWSDADVAKVTSFACDLEASGLEAPSCGVSLDPGNVLLRRLSNFEYDRTVASALGDATAAGTGLAADDHAYGFDSVSSAQTLSIGHLDRYHSAASRLARETLLVPTGLDRTLEGEDLPGFIFSGQKPTAGQGAPVAGAYYHFQRIQSYVTVGLTAFPYSGTYTVSILARGQNASHFTCSDPALDMDCTDHQTNHDGPWLLLAEDVAPKLLVTVDGKPVGPAADVLGNQKDHAVMGNWSTYNFQMVLDAGAHTLRVWHENPVFWARDELDVMLDVDSVTLAGPLASELPAPDQARIERYLICTDWACRDEAILHALTALWRRPASAEEVARYGVLMQDAKAAGETFKDGLEAVLEAALLSPNFLFRPELEAAEAVPATRPLDGFELATRLAYFLWSSPPDDALLAVATKGHLNETAALEKQLDRLLADPRAAALVDHFAAAWLQFDALRQVAPDASLFPEFDDGLRASMAGELRALFANALQHDETIFSLLDSPYSFLDKRLSTYYGLPSNDLGSSFEKVNVAGVGRGGLLATAGMLTLTSHPSRTSPTKRGKWILEQLLCRPPGAPPPGVDTMLDENDATVLTPKELLKKHANSPSCAGCHGQMDPLGFTLEHFDPVGRWRDSYPNGTTVDSTAELPDRSLLADHRATIQFVKNDPSYPACVAKKLLIYALGSDPQRLDACSVEDVERRFRESGHTLRGLVRAIVMSPLFRARRPERPGEYADIFGMKGN